MIENNQLLDKIQKSLVGGAEDLYKHKNHMVVGSNMSGKSDLIKKLVEANIDNIYFIDSVNRTIATDNSRGRFKDIKHINDIVLYRIESKIFNNIDSITEEYDNHLIYNELLQNFSEYESYINEYLGCEFKIEEDEDTESLFNKNELIYSYSIGGEIFNELSNGFQAIIRILIEVVFAISRGIHIIAIEEVDLYLDTQNSKKFIKFLKNKFEEITWIFTTHSPQVVLGSENFNIFKIENGECYYFDGDDMSNIAYINRSLFESSIINESSRDRELSNLLRKMSLGYTIDQDTINKINAYKDLTVKQSILRKYIIGWNNNEN